ncbi:MAG: glycosyltransferase [Armatimonadetes bacterium]|nr:glycosyltransferase [Armatimonadota bacterium]
MSLPVPVRSLYLCSRGEKCLRVLGRVVGWVCRRLCKDALYIGRSYPAGIVAAGAAASHGMPWVLDCRGVFVEEGVEAGYWHFGDREYWKWRGIEYELLREANRVIAVTREHARVMFDRGAEPNRVFVTPCRAPTPGNTDRSPSSGLEKVRTLSQTCRERGGRLYVYSGSLGFWTDLLAIRTMADGLGFRVGRDALLVLTPGGAKQYARLRAIEPDLETLEPLVLSLPTSEMRAALEECDCALLPRRDTLVNQVSCPVKLTEYLCAGLLVCTFPNCGFIGRVLAQQELGVIAGGTGGIRDLTDADFSSEARLFRRRFAERVFGPTTAGKRYATAVLGARASLCGPGDDSEVSCITVAAFTTGPRLEPCTRQRVLQYLPHFHERRVRLRHMPFMSTLLFRIKNRSGLGWLVSKALLTTYCVLRTTLYLPRALRADIVLVQKEAFPFGPPGIERWLAKRRHLVLDFDDSHHLPPRTGWDWRSLWRDPLRLQKTIACATTVTVGNSWLANLANEYTSRPVHTIPTGVPFYNGGELIRLRTTRVVPPTIGWMGTWGSLSYMDDLVPTLQRLARKQPFRMVLVGGRNVHAWRPAGLDVTSYEWKESEEGQRFAEFDIGIMPLVNTQLELGKCAYKVLQYMSAGLPTIASAVGENANVVRHGITGFLADTLDDWAVFLQQLIASVSLRQSMGYAGYVDVRRGYTADHCGRLFAEAVVSSCRQGLQMEATDC